MTKTLVKLILGSVLFFSSFVTTQAFAGPAISPVSFGLLPPVQLPSSEYSITGARFSALWGKHRDVYGLDLGLLGNVTEQSFYGIALSGLFNITNGNTTAILAQAAGLVNYNTNKTTVYGIQFAGLVNANTATSSVTGLQLALLANLATFTNIHGVQVGLYNRAQDVYGLQIGLFNVASNLHGIQIGLLNINQKGLFYISPIINIGF